MKKKDSHVPCALNCGKSELPSLVVVVLDHITRSLLSRTSHVLRKPRRPLAFYLEPKLAGPRFSALSMERKEIA